MIELQENQSLVDTNPMLKGLYASLLSDRPRKILELGKNRLDDGGGARY
jgi:hypothetical protein